MMQLGKRPLETPNELSMFDDPQLRKLILGFMATAITLAIVIGLIQL